MESLQHQRPSLRAGDDHRPVAHRELHTRQLHAGVPAPFPAAIGQRLSVLRKIHHAYEELFNY